MGLNSLSRPGCTVSWRQKSNRSVPAEGSYVAVTPDGFLGNETIQIHPDAEATIPNETGIIGRYHETDANGCPRLSCVGMPVLQALSGFYW